MRLTLPVYSYRVHSHGCSPPVSHAPLVLSLPCPHPSLAPGDVSFDPLGRFVGHLDTVLKDAHGEVRGRCAGQEQAEPFVIDLRRIGQSEHNFLKRWHPRLCKPVDIIGAYGRS